MTSWAQVEFIDAPRILITDLIYFHQHLILILIFILTFTGIIILTSFINLYIDTNLLEKQTLEVIWTLLPVFILVYIGGPSLIILYAADSSLQENFVTFKAIGHQWYWSYEYDFNPWILNFDSYILPQNSLEPGHFRLLDVDNQCFAPYLTATKLIVTSQDVLHSWAIPSLGVKIDACPGRLNQIIINGLHPGDYYGQCSEICGANHRFMPISLKFLKPENLINYIEIWITEEL